MEFVLTFCNAKRLKYSFVLKFPTNQAKMIFELSLIMLALWCFGVFHEIEVD